MENYCLIDIKNGDEFEEVFAATREDAIARARVAWNRLTENEKRSRDAFYLGMLDEDFAQDEILQNHITDIVLDFVEV